jgi:glutathione S-transferase
MGRRPQISVNLPPDIREAWFATKGGLSHTRFGIAALAAYMLLDDTEARDLDTLVAAVDQRPPRADWSRVTDWVKQMQARREARVKQAGRRKAAHARGKAQGKR